MVTCMRCGNPFIPPDPDMNKLCPRCIKEILSNRNEECQNDESESQAILEDVMACFTPDSEVQSLLGSPGVSLVLAKLTSTCDDKHFLVLNSFRVGAMLAFKQSQVKNMLK